MKGMKRAGILCVPKHFPASAGFDPHYSLSVINSSISFLFQLISPFYGLADPALGDARAVMVAHTAVPALDDKIASLSSVIMNGWLRNILWFTGIIICDDFSMAAAGDIHPEEAAVRSVIAGADMILVWPPDLRRTHRAFIEAVYDGRLKYERLHEAASRVIYEKLRMGLME
jgi:beta-N-acetylhexosaminidase